MKGLRRAHLLLGCFFSPMLLFFILSGWYQTMNPDRLKSPLDAETMVQKLRVVHTDQIYPYYEPGEKRKASAKAFQWLVAIMSAAITASVLLGIWLAFKSYRTSWPVWVMIGLGLLVPAILLWLGRGG